MESLLKLTVVNDVMIKYLNNIDITIVGTFLLIASNQKPISYTRLMKKKNLNAVKLSRALKKLIDDDLVTFEIDDHDTRRKIASLTQKGKAFTLELVKAMEDTQ